jgi:beta-phosphoglucomutase family hydrolase
MLGLPDHIRACLFDLDGVLTPTAKIHAAAWKEMFDEFLRARAEASGGVFREFDSKADYDTYVDGRPRAAGTRAFLASRGITLPDGQPEDPPDAETVNGLGNRKNQLVQKLLTEGRIEPYEGSVRYVEAVRAAGLPCAVVSSSANTRAVLKSAGLADLLPDRIDGVIAARTHLAGKPAPDTYIAGAHLLGVEPGDAAVFEDALAGVEAGRAGKFGYVVGVDRVGQASALREHGADVVVTDLADLLANA